MMGFLNTTVKTRIIWEDLRKLEIITENNPELENISHSIRCAIRDFIEENKGFIPKKLLK